MTDPARRALRRRVGPVAWCVLEDLMDDARVDASGRRVAASSVRRLADNLGVGKDTTARALRRLTSADLIAALPAPRAEGGRFGGAAYLVAAGALREDSAVADEGAVAPPEARRRRARSVVASQPSLFDELVDQGASACGSAPRPAEVGARKDGVAGSDAAEVGAPTGQRESAGRESAGREAEAPERSAAG